MATVIALGSATPAALASSYQRLPLLQRIGGDVGDVEAGALVLGPPRAQVTVHCER